MKTVSYCNVTPRVHRQKPFAKEPYYPPGYAGHVPQHGFQCEKSFGRETQRLLLDKNVPKSRNSVLSRILPPYGGNLDPNDKLFGPQSTEFIKETWGDLKYQDPLVPGYGSAIPWSKFALPGKSFSKTCADSKQMFTEYRYKTSSRPGKSSSKYFVPNDTPELIRLATPLKSHRKPYIPQDTSVINERPVTFACSYAGHIPRMRDRHGKSYRRTAHNALKEFVADSRQLQTVQKHRVDIIRNIHPQSTRVIYREEGIIPKYQGYLPTDKFRQGQTYLKQSQEYYNHPKP